MSKRNSKKIKGFSFTTRAYLSFFMNAVLIIMLIIIVVGNLISPESVDMITAIIAAFGAVSVAIISNSLTKMWEKQLSLEQEHKNAIIPIYEGFLPFWFNLFKSVKKEDMEISEEETIEYLQKFTQKIILWGSDEVLNEFSLFRKVLTSMENSKSSENSLKILLKFEKLLYAIRRDIGHQNIGLNQGDILSTFINDIEAMLYEFKENISGK